MSEQAISINWAELNLDELLSVDVKKTIKEEHGVVSVRLDPVTLDEVKKAVENYSNLLTSQEGFKKTKELVPAFSFGTDCSLPSFSQGMYKKFVESGVWPFENGKPVGVVKARSSVAGKLFNRMYSLVSQKGIVKIVNEYGTEKPFIVIMNKDDKKELQQVLFKVFPELDAEVDSDLAEIDALIKGATPLQRRQWLLDYQASQSVNQGEDME